MNKLKNAGDAIKKKLSLQDYQAIEQHDNVPSCDQTTIPVSQLVDIPAEYHTAMPSKQNASKLVNGTPAKQHADNPTSQQTVSTAYQHADKPVEPFINMPAECHASMPATQHSNKLTHQQDDLMAGQLNDKPVKKIKVTHYLSEEDNDRLTSMYIKHLQEKRKIDKSALISQAIQLLFKKENK